MGRGTSRHREFRVKENHLSSTIFDSTRVQNSELIVLWNFDQSKSRAAAETFFMRRFKLKAGIPT